MDPTAEQMQVINEPENCVVIANPGSGKTFTITEKIVKNLKETLAHKGVIAISYTNKASEELKKRVLKNLVDYKSSFFGTIDRFFLSEIIYPFAEHIYGPPHQEVEVVKEEKLNQSERMVVQESLNLGIKNMQDRHYTNLRNIYLSGRIPLEAIGLFANIVFNKSLSCRRYLKARYTHIFVDEYQDAGFYQHSLLLKLHKIGIIAIAVGDINQTIFQFAKKSSRYLNDLAQRQLFKTYLLTINQRCHPSISNYSLSLLSPNPDLVKTDDIRVFYKNVDGNEEDIGRWIDSNIEYFVKIFNVKKMNDIGILTRGKRTAEYISESINRKHKLYKEAALDQDASSCGAFARKVLCYCFDNQITRRELVDELLDVNEDRKNASIIIQILKNIKEAMNDEKYDFQEIHSNFSKLIKLVFPNSNTDNTIKLVDETLSNQEQLCSYKPAKDDEIQILTIHKAKGLEFGIVFHLDLNNYIIPSFNVIVNHDRSEEIEYLNLHYVGVTRAIKACILCSSTLRRNEKGEVKNGEPSLFLTRNNLNSLRKNI